MLCQVYEKELEDIEEYKGLTDFCGTFKLQRGKDESGENDPTVVGEFKVRPLFFVICCCWKVCRKLN